MRSTKMNVNDNFGGWEQHIRKGGRAVENNGVQMAKNYNNIFSKMGY